MLQINDVLSSRINVNAIIIALFIIVIWQLVCNLLNVPSYILPSPANIMLAFLERPLQWMGHFLWTSLETIGGFLLGIGFGVTLGVLFVRFKIVEDSLFPYAIGLKTIPIIAIAPLLVIWFGSGITPKIIISALICFFPTLVNTSKGLKRISPEAIDVFSAIPATTNQIMFYLRIPSALPYVFAALRVSATLAPIGAIVGEFSAANKGLGFMILVSSRRLNTDEMFVGIVLASVLGLGLFYAVGLLEQVLGSRRELRYLDV